MTTKKPDMGLTTKKIEGSALLAEAKAKGGRIDVRDKGRGGVVGLVLRVTGNDVRTWAVMYNNDRGIKRRYTIGPFPEFSLDQARDAARAIRERVARGEDPAEKVEPKAVYTFDLLADAWLDHRRAKSKSRNGRAVKDEERALAKDIRPAIGDMEADTVTRSDIARAIKSIVARIKDDGGKGVRANRVLTIVGSVYNWGVDEELVTTNPAERVKAQVDEAPRDRVLTVAEIKMFWDGIDKAPVSPGTRIAMKLSLVSAQRIGQVSLWAKKEIDTSGNYPMWIAPSASTKNKKANRVPLSKLAMKLIEEASAISTHSGYLFPAPGASNDKTDPAAIDQPINPEAASRGMTRARKTDEDADADDWNGFGIEHFTTHDLRRTTASHMASMKVPEGVIERILDHTKNSRSNVTGIYNRYTYDDEKRDALDLWGARLEAIVASCLIG